MKKTIVIWLLLMVLSPAAHAIIPGIPGLQDPIKMELEIKFTEDRDWKRPGSVEVSTVSQYFIKPIFEVTERLDVFLKFGVADIDILIANGGIDSSYGIGMRYNMPLDGFLPVGEALEARVSLEYTSLSSDVFPMRGHSGGDIKIAGWELSFSLGMDMGMFIPYAGIRYSDMTLSWTEFGTTPIKWDVANPFGVILGANIPRGDLADINIELGLLDGTSLKMETGFVF
ncbi:MAG: hypothetical protein DDT31_00460 [Syntrophomonadaceae bacterium]|nr:hypothetical protein [Bacillota bacterium]